jgi:hypothetical protein
VTRHRAILALAISLAMVVLLAALFPRIYLANDDVGLTGYLRENTYTPWISPILVRALSAAYRLAPGVPWYGLYQYALIVAIGAVLIHTCTELVDPRPGPARSITVFGRLVLGAGHAIIAVGITWTSVSISAPGTALAAFVAHAQICEATGKPMSWLRSLIYGLLFAAGYMLRYQGLAGALVALAPLVGWTAWRFARKRHLPRVIAVIALLAPFAIVHAVQGHVRVADDNGYWTKFNEQRGRIHDNISYNNIDKRAPELLGRAGWTPESFSDFANWKFIDEDEFPLDTVRRLADTGGVPRSPELRWISRQLRQVVDESRASVLLFVLTVIGGVVMAWLGVIERRAVAFSLGYLVFVTGVALWTAMQLRFPQRVSIAYFAVAAFGLYVYLAREIADRRACPEVPVAGGPRSNFAVVVIAVLTLVWARTLMLWIDRDPWPNGEQLQTFEDRVAARKGFVFVFLQAGQVHHDPLRAQPSSFDGLAGGWGTFSPGWYRTLARLGVHRGAEVFRAMLDNPEAYVVSTRGARDTVEDWMQRKLRDPSVRLALVDAAAIADGSRPELYRLVSTPLIRGSEEWRARERLEAMLGEMLPGPPSVADRRFAPIALVAPFEQYLARLHHAAGGIAVTPIDGGLRARVTDDSRDGCTTLSSSVNHVGVHVPIDGLGAARFQLRLIDAENVVSFHVYGQTRTGRSIHWRWERDPHVRQVDFTGTFTLVPGYPAHQLQLVFSTARPADVTDLYFFVAVKSGTYAGFDLRNLEVAKPQGASR